MRKRQPQKTKTKSWDNHLIVLELIVIGFLFSSTCIPATQSIQLVYSYPESALEEPDVVASSIAPVSDLYVSTTDGLEQELYCPNSSLPAGYTTTENSAHYLAISQSNFESVKAIQCGTGLAVCAEVCLNVYVVDICDCEWNELRMSQLGALLVCGYAEYCHAFLRQR